MPDSKQNDAKDLLTAYRRPAITPFVKECLEDYEKNVRAGLFCTILSKSVLEMDKQAALADAESKLAYLLGSARAWGLSDKQTTELAVAFHAEKVEPSQCHECKAKFLRLVDDLNAEDFCFEHRRQHIPCETPKPAQR